MTTWYNSSTRTYLDAIVHAKCKLPSVVSIYRSICICAGLRILCGKDAMKNLLCAVDMCTERLCITGTVPPVQP